MRELGLDAFRFSIAWPRVLPEGRGRVNEAGLDFYDRLVDELLAHEIEPFATLFHWDTPQALEDDGGWPARSTAEAFVEYAEVVAARLGDRVRHWITHNEPWVYAWIGHSWGQHAPGRTNEADAVATAHHLLLSHGWAAEAIRRAAPDAQVGITLNLAHSYPGLRLARGRGGGVARRRRRQPLVPRSDLPRRVPGRSARAQRARRALRQGRRPGGDRGAARLPRHQQLLPLRRQRRRRRAAHVNATPEHEYTDMGWEVYPDGLHKPARARRARLRADRDLHHRERRRVRRRARAQRPRARSRADVLHRVAHRRGRAGGRGGRRRSRATSSGACSTTSSGPFGYSKRFGIVYIDYPTLERVPKDSFYWYRDFIARGRGAPEPSPIATRLT